jgi:hypothetical protein
MRIYSMFDEHTIYIGPNAYIRKVMILLTVCLPWGGVFYPYGGLRRSLLSAPIIVLWDRVRPSVYNIPRLIRVCYAFAPSLLRPFTLWFLRSLVPSFQPSMSRYWIHQACIAYGSRIIAGRPLRRRSCRVPRLSDINLSIHHTWWKSNPRARELIISCPSLLR